MRDNVAYCALGRIFGYEPRTARLLVEKCGSAEAFFNLSSGEQHSVLGPYSKAAGTDFRREYEAAEAELERLVADDCRFVALGDSAYPANLRECEDAPMGLYVKASSPPEEVFGNGLMVAIVGTRDISPYGEEWCRRIVSGLSQCRNKPVIVSGFALGTDIIAHRMALECGLRTIAVLPTGIDEIYPRRHIPDAAILARTEGCALVTDYPTGTQAQAINFLRRNRIIAGLSLATILIESKEKGGGLITSGFAFGYGRDVFALPGRIDDLRSRGCNALIASTKAKAVTDIGMLLRDLGLGRWNRLQGKSLVKEIEDRYGSRSDLAQIVSVAELIKERRGIYAEEICRETGISYKDTLRLITLLESDGIVSSDLLQRCSIVYKY